jgi:hypothetical protein
VVVLFLQGWWPDSRIWGARWMEGKGEGGREMRSQAEHGNENIVYL